MRILYHHRTQGEEPESVHINAIVTALRRLGHEVDIIGPVSIEAVSRKRKASFVGMIKRSAPRVTVEAGQIAYNIKSLVQLCRGLARKRYDFVYERYGIFNLAGLAAARLFHLPIVLEVNTLYAQAWDRYYGLTFRRVARAMEQFAVTRADAIITVTGKMRELLEMEGVNSHRITVAHNAIDPEEFHPGDEGRASIRKELNLRRFVAGFVGTMNRWQGVVGFAEVVEHVVAERGDVGFLFIGDGEGRPALESELRRRGVFNATSFVGRKPHAEIPRFISAVDIGLLLDSNSYGSPMKIFEYWAMGKPVIAPGVPAVMEILRNGETGFVIQPGDARAMARRILQLADDEALREELGRAGRARVLQNHTWEENAQKILSAVAQINPGRSAGERQ